LEVLEIEDFVVFNGQLLYFVVICYISPVLGRKTWQPWYPFCDGADLVSEDVVVDVVLLGRLRRQHERLHERSHRLPVVGKLTAHLSTMMDHSRWALLLY
jgi:hypothetical protein